MGSSNLKLAIAAAASALVVIIAGIAASNKHTNGGNPAGPADSAIRAALLSKKGLRDVKAGLLDQRSFKYSNLLYDLEVKKPFSSSLPWAASIVREPSGRFSFTWRIKLAYRAAFSVSGTQTAFTIKVSDSSGLPVYTNLNNTALPSDNIELEPGTYILSAASDAPLDSIHVRFAPVGKAYSEAPSGIRLLRLKLGLHEIKNLKRLADAALSSPMANVLTMPSDKLSGELLNEAGTTLASARVSLSGRTKGHLEWFPSIDVNLTGGSSFSGMKSFKLNRLRPEDFAYEFIYLSMLNDMGFPVPRHDLVELILNGRSAGVYLLVETASSAMFTSQQRLEGAIVGTDPKKFFFNYPMGATLDMKYFYKPKDAGGNGLDKKAFLSADFVSDMEKNSFARYIAFAAVYFAGHGLGVDDLRFYMDPAAGRFTPIPRDLEPGLWHTTEDHTTYLSNASWSANYPPLTSWPIRKLYKGGFSQNGEDPLSGDSGIRAFTGFTGLTDLHFAVEYFVSEPAGMALANAYMRHFLDNEGMRKKAEARTVNLLKTLYALDKLRKEAGHDYARFKKDGAPFFDSLRKSPLPQDGPLLVSYNGAGYLWNLRTATPLRPGLLPSFTSPLPFGLDEKAYREKLALSFLLDKRIFDMLGQSGISLGAGSFTKTAGLGPAEKGALDIQGALSTTRDAKEGKGAGAEKAAGAESPADVALYLGMRVIGGKEAAVFFLVRNATGKADGYTVMNRDGVSVHRPAVNRLFRLIEGIRPEQASIDGILKNHFLKGEDMRLLAFVMPLANEAVFYTLKVPPEANLFSPPYMYLPVMAQGRPERPHALPEGIIVKEDGLHVEPGSVMRLKHDLVIPNGRPLYIHEGATIVMPENGSITATGDIYILGVKDRPVRFIGQGQGKWGGFAAMGSPDKTIKIIVKHAEFSNFGSFPKNAVAGVPLNGGITFYRADIYMEAVRMAGSAAEDAINLVNSIAVINNIEITDTASDGMDLDFSDLLITDSRFSGIGGDGLDISNSLVVCERTSFSEAKDKGVSVGEMSRAVLRNVSFLRNKTGIANKDQSVLSVKDADFTDNGSAIEEFIKKPYYGSPSSSVEDARYTNNGSDYKWLGLNMY